MAYTKFHSSWEDYPDTTTPITANALEHIEQGIADASSTPSLSTSKVSRSTTQSISTGGSDTPITFDTEEYDTDSYWTSGAATRLTIPVNGYYLIGGKVN